MKRKMKKILNSNGGFSLMELTIAAGITGLLSLAVVNVMETMKKQEKKMTQSFEKQQMQTILQGALANSKTCFRSFEGFNPNNAGVDIPEIKKLASDGNEAVLYSIGQTIGSRGAGSAGSGALYQITEMKIKNYGVKAAQTAIFSMTLTPQGVTQDLIGNSQEPYILEVPVKVQLEEDGLTIKNCIHEAVGLGQSSCEEQFLGDYDPLDLNKQRCGGIILNNSPTPILPVLPSAAALTILEGGLEIGAAAAPAIGNNLDVASSIGVGDQRSSGIGNLSYSGSMAIGSATLGAVGGINLSGGLGVGVITVDAGNAMALDDVIGGTYLRVGGSALPLDSTIFVNDKVRVLSQTLTDMELNHAATIDWVRNRVANTLAPDGPIAGGIALDILNTAVNESGSGLNVIKAAICTRSRVRHADENGVTQFVTGVWNGGSNSCAYAPLRHCSTNGVCDTVYSNGLLQAQGNITAQGSITTTKNLVAVNGFAQARSYIWSNGDITASNYVVGSSICATNTSLCWSTMQSRICTGTQMMLGISNGAVICGSRTWPLNLPYCYSGCTF